MEKQWRARTAVIVWAVCVCRGEDGDCWCGGDGWK